jgi:hypothetical protein
MSSAPNELTISMRSHLSAACQWRQVAPGYFFFRTGINDLLIEAEDCDCPLTIAARTAAAMGDCGEHPNFIAIICYGVWTFLDKKLFQN